MTKISKELLQKYFSNQATAQEARVVLKWFETDDGQAFLKEQLTNDFDGLDHSSLLVGQLDAEKIIQQVVQEQPVKTNWSYRIAASVAIALLLAAVWWGNKNHVEEYATTFGECKTIALPDHSVIMLNSNSKLMVKKNLWGTPVREVWILGEAFFDIAHADSQPFTVHADALDVQVLGTHFNVYDREGKTKVSLEKGKVRLYIEDPRNRVEVEMKPGEWVMYDTKTHYLLKKEQENIEKLSSWKEGKLYFDHSTVLEIASLLESDYGLKLIIDDPEILEQRITGTVPNNNIDSFLLGLAEICGVKIRKENNLIYVTKK